jgi:hypothetical protein
VDEYACVTVWSNPGESANEFRRRLTAFWSEMIRSRPDEYAMVYAESTEFEPHGERLGRQYLIAATIVETMAKELSAARIDHDPVDLDDLYSKYEASGPNWFQIPH